METLNTEIQEVVDLYLAKIENFDYLQYTEEELLEELKPMITSAISKLFTIDVKIDWDLGEFNRELEPIEMNIIALGMVAEFVTQKVNSVKVMKNHLSTKDFNVYSSANMLKQLQSTLKVVQNDVLYWETKLEYHRKAKKILDGDKK